MIIRVFRVRVKPGMQGELERFFREKAIPMLRGYSGLVALYGGKPMEHTPDEFVMISIWKDLTTLQGFSGNQWQEAKILPEEAVLMEEAFVHHYESLEA